MTPRRSPSHGRALFVCWRTRWVRIVRRSSHRRGRSTGAGWRSIVSPRRRWSWPDGTIRWPSTLRFWPARYPMRSCGFSTEITSKPWATLASSGRSSSSWPDRDDCGWGGGSPIEGLSAHSWSETIISLIGFRQGIGIQSQFHATSIEWRNEMKRLATVRGGVAIALMLGIVVAVASSADASPSGQLGAYMRQGLSLKRAQVALATQAQVEAAELPVRLEKALGASFAGMWFEPNTGKFCVGVVSSASRRAAE